MARLFVTNDNQTARVEIMPDDDNEGAYVAICVGHATGRGLDHDNLVHDTHEMWSLADTIEVASIHVDACTRCADADCRTDAHHDAGHRCRKN
jgi:sulfur relay (sulfurtransferase) complex TusBCD TusD component (DsrE family)